MTERSQHAGTRDEHYNLISVLYHALQGQETYGQYVRDAEEAGDKELVEFFRQVKDEEQKRADRAKQLLQRKLGQSGR
jgi:rubrerythrin